MMMCDKIEYDTAKLFLPMWSVYGTQLMKFLDKQNIQCFTFSPTKVFDIIGKLRRVQEGNYVYLSFIWTKQRLGSLCPSM